MSGQNRSPAVMAQRVEPPNSLDDFPTPPWATRAGVHFMRARGIPIHRSMKVGEPTANRGFMVRPLQELFDDVYASDIHDYGFGYAVHDFTLPTFNASDYPKDLDWLIFNPPFNNGLEFVQRAARVADVGIAIFLRMQWLEGETRYAELFAKMPPSYIFQFAERVTLARGRIIQPGVTRNKEGKLISTATGYCWIVWAPGFDGDTRFLWIPPCRERFERPGDYRLEVRR